MPAEFVFPPSSFLLLRFLTRGDLCHPPPLYGPWPFCHNSLEGLRNVRGITRHLRLVETLGVLEPCLTHRDIML